MVAEESERHAAYLELKNLENFVNINVDNDSRTPQKKKIGREEDLQ